MSLGIYNENIISKSYKIGYKGRWFNYYENSNTCHQLKQKGETNHITDRVHIVLHSDHILEIHDTGVSVFEYVCLMFFYLESLDNAILVLQIQTTI